MGILRNIRSRGRILTLVIAGVILAAEPSSAQIRRGRNEGTFSIPASNVIGNGNIVIAPAFSGEVASSGIHFYPASYLTVGITEIMQLTGKMTLNDFRRLGCTEGHFQITTPGNDNLRFFGIAVSGDLYLSTQTDTISGAAITGRPDYHAYIRPSVIADIDWIARFRQLPIKTYFFASMVDNPDLLYRYFQISMRFGMELKLSDNGYSIDVGAGLYKELPNEKTYSDGDRSFAQQRFWIEPAVRRRVFNRFSFVAAARILILQRVKYENPLEPSFFTFSTAFEIPVLLRETNTEAIRTMIFVERNKMRNADSMNVSFTSENNLRTGLNEEIRKLVLEPVEEESQEEVLKRREEIQKKMDEIESLLEDLE